MSTPAELAEQLLAEAERDEAAAFDAQYALAREAQRVLAAMTEHGQARARQWAEDDMRAAGDRRPDLEPEEYAAPMPSATTASPRRTGRTDEDEEDDDGLPARWLR